MFSGFKLTDNNMIGHFDEASATFGFLDNIKINTHYIRGTKTHRQKFVIHS